MREVLAMGGGDIRGEGKEKKKQNGVVGHYHYYYSSAGAAQIGLGTSDQKRAGRDAREHCSFIYYSERKKIPLSFLSHYILI